MRFHPVAHMLVDAPSDATLFEQDEWWDKQDDVREDDVRGGVFFRSTPRKRAFAFVWGAYVPGDDGPR